MRLFLVSRALLSRSVVFSMMGAVACGGAPADWFGAPADGGAGDGASSTTGPGTGANDAGAGMPSVDATVSDAGACAACAEAMVCCEAPLGCAGMCVPDCRVAVAVPMANACPSGLTCNASTGVCTPSSTMGGMDGGPPDGGLAMMPPPPDGGMGMMPPPDGGMRPPPPDGGGSVDGGQPQSDGGSSSEGGSSSVPPGIGTIAGSGGVKIPYSGDNVSIDDTTLVLGDSGSACYLGVARVYVWDGVSSWQLQQELDDPDPTSSGALGTTQNNLNCFGGATAIAGDMAFVSSPLHHDYGTVYAYSRSGTTWTQSASIDGTPFGTTDSFGYALGFDGTHLAVGIPNVAVSTFVAAGGVVIYTKKAAGWSEDKFLSAPVPTAGATFGHAVAFGGSRIAVGASGGVLDLYNVRGSVDTYTVSGTTWTFEAGASGTDTTASDGFGESVALGGTGTSAVLAVGAPGASPIASKSGAAYVFRWDGNTSSWLQNAKLFPSDGASGDQFGFSVAALSSTQVAVGAPGANKVYLYTYAGGQTWNLTTTYQSCPVSIGSSMASWSSLLVTGKASAVVLDTALTNPASGCGGN